MGAFDDTRKAHRILEPGRIITIDAFILKVSDNVESVESAIRRMAYAKPIAQVAIASAVRSEYRG